MDRLWHDKAEKRWQEAYTDTLHGKTLFIVGMGNVGRAAADRARPFGVRVVGVKRTGREGDAAWRYSDKLYETRDLRVVLGEADYVVVALPHTPEPHRLQDAETISAMKRGAYFVNGCCGKVVDEEALIEVLRSGYLSGAALDLSEEEPLPEESPPWDLENVIVSPHSTDNLPGLTNELPTELFGTTSGDI